MKVAKVSAQMVGEFDNEFKDCRRNPGQSKAELVKRSCPGVLGHDGEFVSADRRSLTRTKF